MAQEITYVVFVNSVRSKSGSKRLKSCQLLLPMNKFLLGCINFQNFFNRQDYWLDVGLHTGDQASPTMRALEK
jgi:hypothetical protein